MNKKRKTREQKVRSKKRAEQTNAFSVKAEWLTKGDKSNHSTVTMTQDSLKFFKADLTKTLFLTMLVVALELAFWQILTRH